jgi:hypothetical protein
VIVYGILNYAVFYTTLYLLVKPGYWIFSRKWGQILGGSISLFVFLFILYKYISDDDIDIENPNQNEGGLRESLLEGGVTN